MLEASKGKIEPSEPFSDQMLKGRKGERGEKSRVGDSDEGFVHTSVPIQKHQASGGSNRYQM